MNGLYPSSFIFPDKMNRLVSLVFEMSFVDLEEIRKLLLMISNQKVTFFPMEGMEYYREVFSDQFCSSSTLIIYMEAWKLFY